jgi:hypothetical protein
VSELAHLERLLADAFQGPDPRAALAAAALDPALSADLRARLAGAAPDGVRIAGLLIAKLRFERLLHGSRAAGAWFGRDPAAFARAFRRYHGAVPAVAQGPLQEAHAFEAWRAGDGADA